MKTKTKIQIASVACRLVVLFRHLLGQGHKAIVNRDAIRWDLDLHEGIDFAIYLLGMFERSTVKTYGKLLSPGDTVLDIGANIGAHTLPLARAVGDQGHVIAFEPTTYAYRKLVRNASLNPVLMPRIRAEQLMLSDQSSSSPCPALYSSWRLNDTTASRHPKHLGQMMGTVGAGCERLDDYVVRSELRRIDFIKMDVDGNECSVLRGARQTLNDYRPKLLMEFMPYGLEESGDSLRELVALLKSANYKMYSVPYLAPLPDGLEELDKLIPDGSSINVLCLPSSNSVEFSSGVCKRESRDSLSRNPAM